MIGKLIPILLALVGLGAGVGGGLALRPEPELVAMDNPCGDMVAHSDETKTKDTDESEDDTPPEYDYVKLNNQFIVPVVDDGRISSLVVLSLSLEVTVGQNEAVYKMEPKLRDIFLQVLFDHANIGGFNGDFTKSTRMNNLRTALLETGQKALGKIVNDVLITNVVRQDA